MNRRCVETNEYGEQCALVEYHRPDLLDDEAVDEYDRSYDHRTARSEEAFTWAGTSETCPKGSDCYRDRGHRGECRPHGWLAPQHKHRSASTATQAPHRPKILTPVEGCQLAIKFIASLDLSRDAVIFQKAQHIARELMAAVEASAAK